MNIGDIAPHFSLYNTDRELIESDRYLGKKLVIFFFPAAWTGVCTKEMCTVRDDYSAYQTLDAEVIGISTDSPFALKRFKEDQALPYTLLSDFNKVTIRAYGIYREDFVCDMHGVAERSIFILDAKGTIQYKEVLANAGNLPDFDAAKKALESI